MFLNFFVAIFQSFDLKLFDLLLIKAILNHSFHDVTLQSFLLQGMHLSIHKYVTVFFWYAFIYGYNT